MALMRTFWEQSITRLRERLLPVKNSMRALWERSSARARAGVGPAAERAKAVLGGLGRRLPVRMRIRLGITALAFWVVGSGALGLSAVNAAGEAEDHTRQLAGTVRGLSVGDLSDPATFARLAEQADEAHQSLARTRTRLVLLRPVEFVPLAGGRLREARNTLELGEHLSRSVRVLATVYGELLEAEQGGPDFDVAGVIEDHRTGLREAYRGLVAAARIANGPLALDEHDTALAAVSIPALQALAMLTLESPEGAAGIAGLLSRVGQLGHFATDPWELLADAELIAAQASAVERSARAVAEESRRVAEQPDAPARELELLADAASALAAAARTGERLAGVALAAENGFLSNEFASVTGPLLEEALESAQSAGVHTTALRDGVNSLVAGFSNGSPEVARMVDGWAGAVSEDMAWLVAITEAMRSVLGFDVARTYLMLLQNHNEIRATGGFLGVTVELHVDQGVLTGVVYEDSTDLDPSPLIDNPAAPEPLYWYLWMGRLLFRDANWSPDFPESAETLSGMYLNARGVEVDGVISGTKFLAWDLVDVLGDVRVPHVDQVLTRDLTVQYTEGLLPYPCLDYHTSGRDKRCFDQDLTQALLDHLRSGVTSEQRAGLMSLARDHLDRKNVLLHMRESAAAVFMARQGWDGAVRTPSQDFLMVIDSSLPGHSAARVTRTWDYQVRLRPGGTSTAELLLRYENGHPPVPGTCKQSDHDAGGCYWNYMRVFLPPAAGRLQLPPLPLHEGSEKLIWGYPDADSASAQTYADGPLRGLTEVGAYLTVEPDSVLTFPLAYQLEPSVLQELPQGRYRYRLSLAKQPGMDNDVVRVHVALPDGARVLETSPGDATRGEGSVSWQLLLDGDRDLVVTFELR